MNARNGVESLIEETITLFAECDSSGSDPLLEEAWDLLVSVSQLAGTRLLEPVFGGLLTAADEVVLYLGQLDRVSKVAKDAPFRVPSIALRPLKAAGRFVEQTNDVDDVYRLLMATPLLAAAYSEYLVRTAGRAARPAVDVLELAVRAGSVYRDCLTRSIPNA